VAIAERYAPEHLLIQTRAPPALLVPSPRGSVFLGAWSPEPLGDIALAPTMCCDHGHARAAAASASSIHAPHGGENSAPRGLEQLGPVAPASRV